MIQAPDPVAVLDCLLIGDDLTGACDAAVPFAMRGLRTVVPIGAGAGLADSTVIAISTESRDLELAAARDAVAAARLPVVSASILFKKIDSVLRGHAGVEINAALTAFGCDAALVCPAFPRMNRIVEAGYLRVSGDADFVPIEVASQLRAQGLQGCVHTGHEGILKAICSGMRAVVLDAVCDEDLDRIAAAGLALDCRVLWVGSAGLSSALARTLPVRPRPCHPAAPKGPVLFCIGSDHRVTLAQQAALVERCRALLVHAELTDAECIEAALGRGQHVVLRIPNGKVPSDRLQELVAGAPASALVLSGGNTASLFCRAAGVQAIELLDEIIPGVPRGVIRGGEFDGLSAATKSGGFGPPDALIQVADYFTCRNQ